MKEQPFIEKDLFFGSKPKKLSFLQFTLFFLYIYLDHCKRFLLQLWFLFEVSVTFLVLVPS